MDSGRCRIPACASPVSCVDPNIHCPEMTRDLSSSLTLFYKIAYPVLWGAGTGTLGAELYLHPETQKYNGVMGGAPWWFVYVVLAMSVGGTAFILWYFWRFKYVGIEDGALIVSNYWTDWRVPFSQIEDARQTRFTDPPHITIELKQDVGCGREVVFMPKQPLTFSVSIAGFYYTNATVNTRALDDFRRAVGLKTP